MSRNTRSAAALLVLIGLLGIAGPGSALTPLGPEATRAALDEVFAAAPGRVVPGLLELQLVAAPPNPSRVTAERRTGAAAVDALLAQHGLTALDGLFFQQAPPAGFGDFRDRFFTARLDPAADIRALCDALMALPQVASAWPVLRCAVTRSPVDIVTPNDPNFGAQYYLITNGGVGTLRAKGAWGHSLGDSSVVVAVCDTGVDLDHPDLAGTGPGYLDGNLSTDYSELNGIPGVDDDGNGYADDWRGWDFVNVGSGPYAGEDYAGEDNDPNDFQGHGTSCAGCVSAIANNGVGIASIGWSIRVLPVRIGFAVEDGEGGMTAVSYSTYMASAFNYARVKGVQVINLSYGSSYTPGLQSAVNACQSAGVLMAVSAGNDNSSVADFLGGTGQCVDVAATDIADGKASFSNYGTWVDVCAPGVAIMTTAIDGYVSTQGTSFSSPITAGLMAQIYWTLFAGQRSSANAAAVFARLTETCDDIDALNPGYGGLLGAGRINGFQALGGGSFFAFPEEFATLPEAIDFALAGDTIAVRGSVVATVGIVSPDKELALLGGWSEDYETRDPAGAPSTLQGNGIQPLLVLDQAAFGAACVVDGFRLENGGGASGYYPDLGRYGGNLLVKAGAPTLSHLTFAGANLSDETVSGGGGAFVANTAVTLSQCRFEGNAALRGGGLGLYNATVTLEGCSFEGNSATHEIAIDRRGGAVHLAGSSLLGEATFSANTADDSGGALYVDATSAVDLAASSFTGNLAGPGGGAIEAVGSVVCDGCGFADNSALAGGGLRASGPLTLGDCDFSGNGDPATTNFGGAIHALAGAVLDVHNCRFRGDEVAIQGAAFYAAGASGSFVNCSVDGVTNTFAGCAIACNNAPVAIRNSQFTNLGGGPPIFASGASLPTAAYNNFFGNGGSGDYLGFASSEGDTHADPLYADRPAGDLHLHYDSPALDSGDPALLDVDGGRSDIGAYGGPAAAVLRPASPTGLTVVAGGPRAWFVELDWDDNLEADLLGYAVYRGDSASFAPSAANRVALVDPAASTWRDDVPDGETTFYYRVSAYDMGAYGSGYSGVASGIGQNDTPVDDALPVRFALAGAFPNPFNPSTRVDFALPADAPVRVEIIDASGRRLREEFLGRLDAGEHSWTWDGRDGHGHSLAAGVYNLRVTAGPWSDRLKLTLLK